MKSFKKSTLLLLTVMLAFGTAFAQKKKEKEEAPKDENKYKKLVGYYEKEKYIDVLYLVDKYNDNEKYNRDPEPYLYASMSYLAIYKDPDLYDLKKYPELKAPLKDALSNFAKFRKRDKSGEMYEQNKNFADELKTAVLEETSKFYEKKDMTHLSAYSRNIVNSFPQDDVMQMIAGGYLVFSNNLSDGLKPCDAAVASLKKKADSKSKLSENEAKGLSNAFIAYTDYLYNRKDKVNIDKAKDAIAVAHQWLPDDEKVNKQVEKLK